MKQRGFTLIEMILTIVVVAIIFLGIAGFVEFGAKGYTQTIDRQRLQNQARFAIEKMSREVQHAVPNSFALSDNNKCLTFYPIEYAGFYKYREPTGDVEFVVGNDQPTAFSGGSRLVINPSRIEDLQNNGQSVEIPDGKIPESGGDYFSITMNLTSQSSGNRHYIYQDKAVIYCIEKLTTTVNSARMVRYYGAFDDSNLIGVVVASGVAFNESSFSYQQTSLQRGGLIHFNFLFHNGDEQSQYKHDVQVSNVP
ncbi:MSHA biogenesis protein MshO [Vibrio inusitatus NBRC 102082]|uniref:MSHA biogenesis protein MshO n=1 Tax=Vibrio inusitatus NBRC 102082 TaxID=1219070 RepID=A0A4Y3I1Z8_9VIBR|nr:prepilin-type N-terminal cleavage/methylation domain-containing protein [Vibrio inusitatus]GEA52484.1 MSHA biogenesis protein MshO [Vibrio inusitatus NBRC 102082]